ncbi:MAG: MATE family efflux transporter [Lachnospiraceae bacterium]|nr:MATE family efflux transporter [Lachnospiraceae bacterium]
MAGNKEQQLDLTKAPIGKTMLNYSLPCIISLLVAALYNIVDQIFIGWGVGAEGNGATNIVFPLTVMALAIATMIGDGACSYVSFSLGRKDSDSAHRSVGNAIVLVIASGILLMLIYLIFQAPILKLFGATEEVSELTRSYAVDYFRWIAIGIPFYMFGQALNPIIRSDGSPRIAMVATLAGAIANMILDPIAIFGLGWGVQGAAIATVAGQVITAVISLVYVLHMKEVHLSKESFPLKGRLIRRFVPLGFTSFLSQFSLVLSMAVMNNMVTKYGVYSEFAENGTSDTPLAVLGIVMKFFQIMISIVVGMAAGCIPVVGFNYGAGRYDRCRGFMKRLLMCEFLVGVVALLIFQLFPTQLISLFGTSYSEAYFSFARYAFRIYLVLVPLDCVCKACFIFLQSLGKAVESTLLSLLREVVFSIPFAIFLPWIFGKLFGMENAIFGLLLSMPAAVLVTFIIAVIMIAHTWRQLKDMEQKTEGSLSA